MNWEGRFWAKVYKSRSCWLWLAAKQRHNGLAVFAVEANRPTGAHRLAWELEHGPIPQGYVLHHRCDVPYCVRPSHLRVCTQHENLLAASDQGRMGWEGASVVWPKLTDDEWIEYADQLIAYRSPVSRFWAKVDKSGDCWEWIGVTTDRYGYFHYKGISHRAHRYAWELVHGPIPNGLFVCHKCDNKRCVNPSHLFLGTHLDNMRDYTLKGLRDRPIGSKNGNAKLDELDVRTMRMWYAAGGITYAQLGKHFNLHKSYVGELCRGKHWRHVP